MHSGTGYIKIAVFVPCRFQSRFSAQWNTPLRKGDEYPPLLLQGVLHALGLPFTFSSWQQSHLWSSWCQRMRPQELYRLPLIYLIFKAVCLSNLHFSNTDRSLFFVFQIRFYFHFYSYYACLIKEPIRRGFGQLQLSDKTTMQAIGPQILWWRKR